MQYLKEFPILPISISYLVTQIQKQKLFIQLLK